MVRTLASTGRRSLYVGSHVGAIVSRSRPAARGFVFDLIEHATRPEFVHVYRRRLYELVIWG